jgi:hypothetical protein
MIRVPIMTFRQKQIDHMSMQLICLPFREKSYLAIFKLSLLFLGKKILILNLLIFICLPYIVIVELSDKF